MADISRNPRTKILTAHTPLTDKEEVELVCDLEQAVIDYRDRTGRTLDDDNTTNALNMWITRLGGERR